MPLVFWNSFIISTFLLAQARFLKQDKKAAREALKEGNVPPPSAPTYSTTSLSASSAYDPNFSNQTTQNLNKKKPSNKKHVPIYMQHKYDDLSPGASYKSKLNQPKQSEIVDLSSDDDESDDEVHHFEASIVINTSLSLLY